MPGQPAGVLPVLLTVLLLAPYENPQVAFRFTDPRVTESSGLASSSRVDDVLFTHNDSGDEARFFAIGATGTTLVTYVLPQVMARDWEDMARGPDENGRSSLWLADIGDNDALRENGILVHRVREPLPGRDRTVTTEAPTSFRLRYTDGPRDAETLLVHPRTGRLYVVTKPGAGPARVYAAPQRLDPAAPNVLELAGQVELRRTGTGGGPDIGGLAQLLVTAGDISPDGSRVALRTYTDLYEWAVPGDDVPAAFAATEPTVTPLPATRQGEGLAYSRDGRAVLVSSEGEGAPVHRLTAAGTASGGVAGLPQAREAAPDPRGKRSERLEAAVYAGLAALILAVLLALRRSRRRRRVRRPTGS